MYGHCFKELWIVWPNIAHALHLTTSLHPARQGRYTCYLLYKAEKPSVCLSVRLSVGRLASNSVVSACIDVRLALRDSYVLWHVQVCFKKFLSAVVCSPER